MSPIFWVLPGLGWACGDPWGQGEVNGSDDPKRPILALLTSHWISMLGVALVTTAGFSWLFVLPIQVRGHTSNPYIGIVVFIVIPAVLILGLVLIALGIYLARRRLAKLEQG